MTDARETLFDARSDWPPFHIMLGLLSPVAFPLLALLGLAMRAGMLVERFGCWAVASK